MKYSIATTERDDYVKSYIVPKAQLIDTKLNQKGDMIMDKAMALRIWEDIYGDDKWAQDCFGTWMYKSDYGDREKRRNNRPGGTGEYYEYGWEIDHIRPKSSFEDENDAELKNNYEPMNWNNNNRKGDNYPNFQLKGHEYTIVSCDICAANHTKGYGIERVSNHKRIDWKYMQNACYGG